MLPIGGKVVLLLFLCVTGFVFGQRVHFLIKLLKLGRAEDRSGHLKRRLKYTLDRVLTGRCTLKNVSRGDYAGIGHLLLLYGFLLFVVSYIFHIAEGLYEKLSPAIFGNIFNDLFFLLLDIAGLVVIAVIIWAAIRRYMIKPDRLEPTLEAGIILIFVVSLILLHYIVEGFRLIAENEPFANWSFVGRLFSQFFMNLGLKENAHILFSTFWWLHLIVVFGFSVYVLYSKHLHILASHFNLFFHSTSPKGSLQSIRDLDKAKSFGVSRITQFSWKHLLDLYACTECGRCTANCPASISGEPLRPRDIIHNLKVQLLARGKDLLLKEAGGGGDRGREQVVTVGQVVGENEIWACTTCHACIEVCPVDVEHVEKIVSLRRHLVMEEAKFPSKIKSLFRNLEMYGDTYGRGPSLRTDWAEGLPVKKVNEDPKFDVLYWAGCEGTFQERNKEVSKVIVSTIHEAGISVGILGKEERCCGDPVRRIGNEYLFQELVRKNIETFKHYGIRKVITYCPHCYNTLKNEYSLFGDQLQVIHYSEYFHRLLQEGRLKVKRSLERRVTFHDPCYLGRVNGIYEAPREILQRIPGLQSKEMTRSKTKSFCCGGGGGRMWMHENVGQRMNNLRAREAIETGVDFVATACPYCLTMIEDGIKNQELEKLSATQNLTLDISEILYRAII